MLRFDNASLNSSEMQALLDKLKTANATRNAPPRFVDKHEHQLDSNLILDTTFENNDKQLRYLIVSSNPDDVLGRGSFSTTRKITQMITFDLENDTAKLEPAPDLVARVRNSNAAEKQHLREGTEYQYSDADDEYAIGKAFGHLGMHAPVHVEKDRKGKQDWTGGVFQKKSYIVMNKIPGENIGDAVVNYHQCGPTTKEIVESVIIPMLQAYKQQILDNGYEAHRDIQPANILSDYDIKTAKFIVNFIDFDTAIKSGDVPQNITKPVGTAGYLAPEIPIDISESHDPKLLAKTSRDIFSLGVLCIQFLNPYATPVAFFDIEHPQTSRDLLEAMVAHVQKFGFYDVDQTEDHSRHLFALMDENEEVTNQDVILQREAVRAILKDMTSANVSLRDTLKVDDLIMRFQNAVRLQPQQGFAP